jgi:hypothetical protein
MTRRVRRDHLVVLLGSVGVIEMMNMGFFVDWLLGLVVSY